MYTKIKKFFYGLQTLFSIWLFLSITLFLIPFSVVAQNSPVEGKVTDAADGSPLIGATVLIKSTAIGTTTHTDGSFSLNAKPGDVITVSYVGYISQDVPVNSGFMAVTLKPDMKSINEIVVVGFGKQKKINLSGAVDAVGSEVLESRPIQTVAQGLQGVVPNLNIDFLSGEPGATPNINIRGFTSIGGGGPLIIVDGVPTEPVELNYLSPEDIDNISVLKDASSSAIYGARASYGVILITTKTGKGSGMKISYSSNFSRSKPTVLPDKITDPYIYLRLQETSTNNTPWDNMNYSDETYAWARERSDNPSSSAPVRLNPNDNSMWEYMGNKDWTKYYLDDYTYSQKHNFSIGGSSSNITYYFSSSYDDQKGALKIADDKFDRYTINGKMNFKPYKWLSIGNNTLTSLNEREKPYYFSVMDIYNLSPTDWDVNPDGSWANNDAGRMGAKLTQGGRIDNKTNSFQTTFSGELNFFDRMLKLNADYSIRMINGKNHAYESKYNIGYGPGDIRQEGSNSATDTSLNETYSVLNIYSTFEKNFGLHAFNAILGFNQENNRNEWMMAEKDNVISSSLPTIGLATGNAYVNERIAEWAIRGAFFRLNYNYNEKYILELNGRYDGSSKFPKNDRFGFFPSASVAWRIDNEKFWKPVSNVVSLFKIRASYGSLGNQSVNEYGYIATMNASQGGYLIGGGLPQIVSSAPLVSPNYTWEKVNSQNLGVDLGFFQHKLTATVDIYRRDTKGMLTQGKDLPGVLGTSEPNENSANLKTNGWELSVGFNQNFNIASKPLLFHTSLVLSDSRSFITRFDNPNKSLINYYEGMELGEMWGLKSDGLFKNQNEIANLDETAIIPWGALSIVEGWPKYKDLDGDHKIEKGTTVNDPKDLSVIGNISPRYRFGFNLNFEWNGIDLNAFFQGVAKMDYYPIHYLYWGFYQQPYAGGYKHLLNFYRATGELEAQRALDSKSYIAAGLADANTNAKYPVLQSWLADRNLGERIDESMGLAIPQTGYMLNGAYLRLKNVTVGYSLPKKWMQKIKISKIRIYASGENITEWSQLKKYFDPEAITDNASKMSPSFDAGSGSGYAYPFQRRYSVGINVEF